MVVFWSVVLWLVNALSFYLAFLAFDLPVGYVAALVLQGVLVFGIAVPSAPGYVGPFEAVITAVLAVYGIGREPGRRLRGGLPPHHVRADHPPRRLVRHPHRTRARRHGPRGASPMPDAPISRKAFAKANLFLRVLAQGGLRLPRHRDALLPARPRGRPHGGAAGRRAR